jgi:hypothetical protein
MLHDASGVQFVTLLHCLKMQVASQMARPASEFQVKETVPEIEKSCRADLAHFPDPTVQLQLQLQLAITAERYSEASRCEPMSCICLIAETGGLCYPMGHATHTCQRRVNTVARHLLWSWPCTVQLLEEALVCVRRIRNQIDNLLASDRALSLVVAIETALEDKRFEVQSRVLRCDWAPPPLQGCTPACIVGRGEQHACNWLPPRPAPVVMLHTNSGVASTAAVRWQVIQAPPINFSI